MMACAIRKDDMTGWLMAWARLMAQNVWSFQPLLLFLCICAPLQLVGCSVSHIALYILCDFVHNRLYTASHYGGLRLKEGFADALPILWDCKYFEKKMEHTPLFLVLQNGKCMELSGGTFPVLTFRNDYWQISGCILLHEMCTVWPQVEVCQRCRHLPTAPSQSVHHARPVSGGFVIIITSPSSSSSSSSSSSPLQKAALGWGMCVIFNIVGGFCLQNIGRTLIDLE